MPSRKPVWCKICGEKFKPGRDQRSPYFCSDSCAKSPSAVEKYKRRHDICLSKGCQNVALSGHPNSYCGDHITGRAFRGNGPAPPRPIDEELCLWCGVDPQDVISDPHCYRALYCGTMCFNYALESGPFIFQIPSQHPRFKDVRTQFVESWRHPTSVPRIKFIYAIINTKEVMQRYNRYKKSIALKMGQTKNAANPGNEHRRWHGSRRACNLGDDGVTQLCTMEYCSLCHIIRESFSMKHWGSATNWGRFGCGLYASSTSSKSNDYVINSGPSSTKALLLNHVVVGRGKKLYRSTPNLTGPPSQYDSVLGEVGEDLNYDELVVYNDAAIRPSYLVIYA